MASPIRPDRENERELRAKILAGSQELEEYSALADILRDSGREDEALAVWEQALHLPLLDVQRARISAEAGLMLSELGRPERAMAMAKRALSHIAGQAETPEVLMIRGISHATLASCQYATDRASSDRAARLALESFEQLLNENPNFEDFTGACLHAAGVHVLREDYARAIALYEKAMRRDISDRNRLYCLVYSGNALRFQARYAEGEARLREALELVEADKQLLPRICFEFGKVQCLTNRPEEAAVSFEQALAALDVSPVLRRDRRLVAEIKWELGNLYYDAQRYGEAILKFREVLPDLLETYPYLYCDSLITLGHSYLVTGQYAKARDCYEEVLASRLTSDAERATAQEGLSRLPSTPPPTIH